MNKDINEKYYWKKEDGTLVPKHELADYHICNIVMKFGKQFLINEGHSTIVRKFEELNREYDFFKIVKAKE